MKDIIGFKLIHLLFDFIMLLIYTKNKLIEIIPKHVWCKKTKTNTFFWVNFHLSSKKNI